MISQYDGDYSASISAEIEDKSVSLDIYNMTHEMVKITDEKNNPIDVSSGGVYVCMRISDKFGLKKGDTVLIMSSKQDLMDSFATFRLSARFSGWDWH